MDTKWGTNGNVYKSWAFREPQPQRNRPHGYNHTCAKQDGTGDVYIRSELAVIVAVSLRLGWCSVYLNTRSKRMLCIPSEMPNKSHVFPGGTNQERHGSLWALFGPS